MLKNDSLTAASFVLSLLAIVFSVANFNFSPSTDTFVGIMAGLIGVCATIMVGFQIFNSIDTRNKLQEIANLQDKLNNELIKTKKENEITVIRNRIGQNRAYGLSLHIIQPFHAYISFFKTLSDALLINDIEEINSAIHDLEVLIAKLIKRPAKNIKFTDKEINYVIQCNFESISNHPSAMLIEKQYKDIFLKVVDYINNNKFDKQG